jgi:hypothetical protein
MLMLKTVTVSTVAACENEQAVIIKRRENKVCFIITKTMVSSNKKKAVHLG